MILLRGLLTLVYATTATSTDLTVFKRLAPTHYTAGRLGEGWPSSHYTATRLGEGWPSTSLLSCVHTCMAVFTYCYSVTYNTNSGMCMPGSRIVYSENSLPRAPDDLFYFTNFCNRQLGFEVYIFNTTVQCLRVSSSSRNYTSARNICTGKGARLYMPNSRERMGLMRYIVNYITQGSTWIGLNDLVTEKVFVWEDGQEVNNSVFPVPWRAGNPDDAGGREDCMEIGSFRDFWYVNDQYCGETARFVCEAIQI